MADNVSANNILSRTGNGTAYLQKTLVSAGNVHTLVVSTDSSTPIESISPAGSTFAATIDQAGNTITVGIDLGAQRLHRIIMPAAWTAAALTFQASIDGSTFSDLYSEFGEYTVANSVAGASRSIVIDPAMFYGVRYIKVRSGISGSAVAQAASRALTLVTVPR